MILLLGLLAWGGQILTSVSRSTAVRLGLAEASSEVDPAFDADIRGEAAWDVLTLWALPLAGLLLMLGESSWAYFGLAGGAIYVYFGGRGIAQRTVMQRRTIRAGAAGTVRTAIVALTIWGAAGIVTILLAASDLKAS